MKYFIANWKANKNLDEANQWADTFIKQPSITEKALVVVAPPFPLIFPVKTKLAQQPAIRLSAQDISLYDNGSYTGEVTAGSLKGLVDYVIIGHNERKQYFNENSDLLFKKTGQAIKNGLRPIFCVRNEQDAIPPGVDIVAYEPVAAVGTGDNESVENVLKMKTKLKLPAGCIFIYGGSVDENNVTAYLRSDQIDGLLVGKASLDPDGFYRIIKQALL